MILRGRSIKGYSELGIMKNQTTNHDKWSRNKINLDANSHIWIELHFIYILVDIVYKQWYSNPSQNIQSCRHHPLKLNWCVYVLVANSLTINIEKKTRFCWMRMIIFGNWHNVYCHGRSWSVKEIYTTV